MADLNLDYVLDKYGNIIKEEINVKELTGFGEGMKISKIFKPVGSKLSAKFGKDTGNIIKFGKMGNIEELEDGKVKVFNPKNSGEVNERVLEKEDYEIAYQGIDGDDIAIDGDVIAKLDLELTPELEKEGMAREVSRFLNQMRKEADYKVDAKVAMYFDTNDDYMREVISDFKEFLMSEGLLSSVSEGTPQQVSPQGMTGQAGEQVEGDIKSIFNIDERTVTFSLKK